MHHYQSDPGEVIDFSIHFKQWMFDYNNWVKFWFIKRAFKEPGQIQPNMKTYFVEVKDKNQSKMKKKPVTRVPEKWNLRDSLPKSSEQVKEFL